MNTETRFYFLLSFDESYSLHVINATGFKNNIPAETALGSGTIDNLQTFLKYPFPFWWESLSLMQASQQNHIYSWITIQEKLTSNFSRETAARIITMNLVLELISIFFLKMPIAFIQFCLLCFEADVWRKSYLWLKLMALLSVCFSFNYLFLFTLTLKKTKPTPLIW